MQKVTRQSLILFILQYASIWLFVLILLFFTVMSDRFLSVDNLMNIIFQTSSIGIVAIGMTFVLLTAGIDLSVGSVMFLCAAIAGKCIYFDYPLPLALLSVVAVGLVCGALNGYMVTKHRMMPFIVTLAALFLWRGAALGVSQTRAMNIQDKLTLASIHIAQIPLPVWIFIITTIIAHLVLTRTPYGRQIYAVGNDPDAARKAGIPTQKILFSVYVISGICATVGGFILLAQSGAVNPQFGKNREFDAISAAVLGGTSLFGGRGNILPGTVIGAILIKTVDNGLVILQANPYIYPLVTSGIIFLAVLLDSQRNRYLKSLKRKKIRVEAETA
ncbi:ribose ABC transporter permease [bacterium]|nr:ribose ABC transporter permease [bacterium]